MPHPDPQLVLERGRKARELIADETFLSVIDDLSDYHLAALVAAPPGAAGLEARDHHHLLHHAIREIAADLQGRVAAAEEIERLLRDADDEDEDA